MKRFHRPFFALLLSLLLIASQQAAFAHLLSHLRGGPEAVSHYQGEHGTVDKLADTCTTCIAFAGIGGSTPPSSFALSFAAVGGEGFLFFTDTSVFARPLTHRRARGPPAIL